MLLSPSLIFLEVFAELQDFVEPSWAHWQPSCGFAWPTHCSERHRRLLLYADRALFLPLLQHTAGKVFPKLEAVLAPAFLGTEGLKGIGKCVSLPMQGLWEGLVSEKDLWHSARSTGSPCKACARAKGSAQLLWCCSTSSWGCEHQRVVSADTPDMTKPFWWKKWNLTLFLFNCFS